MRLASYNIENLFLRARARNMATWSDGQPAIDRQKQLNALLNKEAYSPANKAKILTLLTELGLDKRDDGAELAVLRQNHGKLLTRPQRGRPRVVATGGHVTATISNWAAGCCPTRAPRVTCASVFARPLSPASSNVATASSRCSRAARRAANSLPTDAVGCSRVFSRWSQGHHRLAMNYGRLRRTAEPATVLPRVADAGHVRLAP